jgi:hypothetical protein
MRHLLKDLQVRNRVSTDQVIIPAGVDVALGETTLDLYGQAWVQISRSDWNGLASRGLYIAANVVGALDERAR